MESLFHDFLWPLCHLSWVQDSWCSVHKSNLGIAVPQWKPALQVRSSPRTMGLLKAVIRGTDQWAQMHVKMHSAWGCWSCTGKWQMACVRAYCRGRAPVIPSMGAQGLPRHWRWILWHYDRLESLTSAAVLEWGLRRLLHVIPLPLGPGRPVEIALQNRTSSLLS